MKSCINAKNKNSERKAGFGYRALALSVVVCLLQIRLVASALEVSVKDRAFKLGIENITEPLIKQLEGKRIGLITNQTGLDQQGESSVAILLHKGLKLSYLFAPEHGVDGKGGAGEAIANSVDAGTKISIVSLYGHGTGKMIPEKVLDQIDVIMFDVQDSGMRHFTYISTLYHALRVAQQNNKLFIVFDRPNPLGVAMEGPVTDEKLRSFISIAGIPLRHGMTVGELAWYFNAHELKEPARLQVVKMKNYNRAQLVCDNWACTSTQNSNTTQSGNSTQSSNSTQSLNSTQSNLIQSNLQDNQDNLPAPLSPGLRTKQACYGYSFLGLLGEIAPFGIGLNTEGRFQVIALPKKMGIKKRVWARLQQRLKQHGIDSVAHTYINPKTNNPFEGLRLHIKDINKVHAFAGLYTVLSFFKEVGVNLSFSRDFDHAVGTRTFRELLQGKHSPDILAAQVNTQLSDFLTKARESFMYTPFPSIQLIKTVN
jgi:hypothetical protein